MTYEELMDTMKKNPALRIRKSELEKLAVKPEGVVLQKRSASGWREDLNRYFRSSWEANIARYLNYIKEPWNYEDSEWEFPVKRGNRFYKCDFHLTKTDVYWEVKGYMDPSSAVKLKRMAKYYPEVCIKIIAKDEYREIAKFKNLIPRWEYQTD